ncbi:arsenate reductase family protein [Chengkuizengella axinellae]|uniref:Arsenate reductase family protein n=1 Tax=Chengkuizengella axinellae TaxID=3064388 RepID=A0ABT9J0S9_9BACL|nr:arsenate reductase family protein [Chengkuizengella sp. 2205SS18-9]MDP5275198.1 arsenate reductase family protein [Chengkuizengella sp. 2205SS18-9]
MSLKVYEYSRCGTCRKAIKWFKEKNLDVHLIPIVEEPPSASEISDLIETSGLDIKKFFNTSGQVYKEMSLKDKLPSMSTEEKIDLLASNGKLLKRPIVTDGDKVTVGFKEETYDEVWGMK